MERARENEWRNEDEELGQSIDIHHKFSSVVLEKLI
jgi:hypothetical protein